MKWKGSYGKKLPPKTFSHTQGLRRTEIMTVDREQGVNPNPLKAVHRFIGMESRGKRPE